MSWLSSIGALAPVFAFLGIGYLISLAGWMPEEARKMLGNLVIYVAVPCSIFHTMTESFTIEQIVGIATPLLGITAVSIGALFLTRWLAKRVLRLPFGRWGIFGVMCAFPNIVFIGMPVALSILGDAGMPGVLAYFISQTVLFWVLGTQTIRMDAVNPISAGPKETFFRVMNINIWVILFAIVFVLLGWKVPGLLGNILSQAGSIATPLSLIFCGSTLFGLYQKYGMKGLAPSWDIGIMLLIRHLVMPGVIFLTSRACGTNGMMQQALVLVAAMPSMTQAVMMAQVYGSDVDYAARGFFWSCMGAIVVISCYVLLLTA